MGYRKLILLGVIAIASVVPAEAAVYGSLKQDMTFKTETKKVERKAKESVTILEEKGENYLIKVGESSQQLVNKNLISIPGIITKVKVAKASLLKDNNIESEVLLPLELGDLVMVLEKEDDYYKVKVNDVIGYIEQSQVENGQLKSLDQTKGEEVVAYAKKYLGGRYVYGGNNLNTGVDCSGFTSQIMKKFNVHLARSSRGQYASNGVRVSKADIKPGDLVFYGYGGSVSHVAIYAGEGKIIHASTERTGIIMSDLGYGQPLIGIKRVL